MFSRIPLAALLLTLACAPAAHAEHGGEAPTSKQQTVFNRIDQSLGALSEALTRIGEEKGRQEFASAMNRTAREHQARAQQLLASGHPEEAREQLDHAMVAVKTAIATLRNRETLIRSLTFDNPVDEYQYELDRFHTYAMLVNLLLERMQPDPAKRQAMEDLVRQAEARERDARQQAEQTDYPGAIKTQEASNKLLLQAIRRGGIYVPG